MGDREAQALAKLTAGVGELRERVSGGFAAGSADVAFVLSGLERGPYLMARAKYLEDESVVKELEIEGLLEASKFIFVTDKGRFRPGIIRGLVRLAMQETIAPQLCPACDGRGDVPGKRSLAMQTCNTCGGNGIKAMPTRKRAQFMRRAVDGFTEWWQWEREANQVFNLLSEWEVTAVRHIAGRLG